MAGRRGEQSEQSSREPHRVVVTGIGLVTPLGADRETSWRALHGGQRAVRRLDGEIAGEIGAPAPVVMSGNGSGLDPVVELALAASREALDDGHLDPPEHNRERIGCVVGTSKGGLRSFARAFRRVHENESPDFPALLWEQFLPNAAAATVAATFGLRGPAICPVAACATGLTSLLRGYGLIRDGYCDAVLAGSSDASLQPAVLASFGRMGVLARGFADPAEACRPFDRRRNGFAVGEGAGMLLLERRETALDRGVRPYAEWLAGGTAADAAGLTQLDEQAETLSRLIRETLQAAGITAREIDYINLHGTATVPNDLCETRAIHNAFGSAAGTPNCSSLKGAIGHLLGGAGSVETAATLLAMRDGLVPPTVNLEEPDEACDLDYTPQESRRRPIDHALKLSLGFGGHLAAGVLRRYA